MKTLLQDLRFGFRMLRRSPGFTVLALLCLTLGIGSNAAVFSWIEGILIRPYPLVSHQDRMFALVGTTRGVEGHNGLSYPDFVDFEKNATLFESLIVDKITGTSLSVGDRAEIASVGIVTANSRPRIQIRRRNRTQCASGGRDQLSNLERSLQVRPGDYRQDAISQWRAAHDRWRRTGKISRHVHRLLVQLLGADVDAGDIRLDRLQIGKTWGALDRRLRISQTWRYASAGTGRAELDRAAFGK